MSIKHRISIGKVVNGEWKYERYASGRELDYLRISVNGNVELESSNERDDNPDARYWIDVSDTHRVEWGMKTNDKHGNPLDIYNGDIFVDWNTGRDECSSDPVAFELFIYYDFLCADQFPMVEILGNVNENPELLEVGK